MENKLIEYGFLDWQVDILLKKKKLKTGHGEYKLSGDKLTLKTNSEVKEVAF